MKKKQEGPPGWPKEDGGWGRSSTEMVKPEGVQAGWVWGWICWKGQGGPVQRGWRAGSRE